MSPYFRRGLSILVSKSENECQQLTDYASLIANLAESSAQEVENKEVKNHRTKEEVAKSPVEMRHGYRKNGRGQQGGVTSFELHHVLILLQPVSLPFW